jgi:hypothetical protein
MPNSFHEEFSQPTLLRPEGTKKPNHETLLR